MTAVVGAGGGGAFKEIPDEKPIAELYNPSADRRYTAGNTAKSGVGRPKPVSDTTTNA